MAFIILFAANNAQATASASSSYTNGLLCSRVRDEITISIGDEDIYFTEVITMETELRRENFGSRRNRATLFALPILVRRNQGEKLLFPVLKPTVTVSTGHVEDVEYKYSDGRNVEDTSLMTPDGLYRLFVIIGREIPRRFTVVISMTVKRNHKDEGAALLCKMSDDGNGTVFGKPESMLRILDRNGTSYIARSENATMRPDEHGWLKLVAERQYLVESDPDKSP